jgi:hypothetical protein
LDREGPKFSKIEIAVNCAVCNRVALGTWDDICDELIDAGWIPHYRIGRQEIPGPVCPDPCRQHLRPGDDGEWKAKVPPMIPHRYS